MLDDSAKYEIAAELTKSMNSWKSMDESELPNKSKKNKNNLRSQAIERPEIAPTQRGSVVDKFMAKIRMQSTKSGKGGKTVTTIKGLEYFPEVDACELLKSIKHKLSVGGRREKDGSMEIQGDQTSILLDFFSKAGYKDVKRG
jgi:translation initiation factor 1